MNRSNMDNTEITDNESLSERERAILKTSFKLIREMREEMERVNANKSEECEIWIKRMRARQNEYGVEYIWERCWSSEEKPTNIFAPPEPRATVTDRLGGEIYEPYSEEVYEEYEKALAKYRKLSGEEQDKLWTI